MLKRSLLTGFIFSLYSFQVEKVRWAQQEVNYVCAAVRNHLDQGNVRRELLGLGCRGLLCDSSRHHSSRQLASGTTRITETVPSSQSWALPSQAALPLPPQTARPPDTGDILIQSDPKSKNCNTVISDLGTV